MHCQELVNVLLAILSTGRGKLRIGPGPGAGTVVYEAAAFEPSDRRADLVFIKDLDFTDVLMIVASVFGHTWHVSYTKCVEITQDELRVECKEFHLPSYPVTQDQFQRFAGCFLYMYLTKNHLPPGTPIDLIAVMLSQLPQLA